MQPNLGASDDDEPVDNMSALEEIDDEPLDDMSALEEMSDPEPVPTLMQELHATVPHLMQELQNAAERADATPGSEQPMRSAYAGTR